METMQVKAYSATLRALYAIRKDRKVVSEETKALIFDAFNKLNALDNKSHDLIGYRVQEVIRTKGMDREYAIYYGKVARLVRLVTGGF